LACSLTAATYAQEKVKSEKELRTATVMISVIGDKPMDIVNGFRVVAFQEEHGQTDLSDRFLNGFRKDKAFGIPYGRYRARVYVNGFWGAAEETTQVSQPDVLVVIDMRSKPPARVPIPEP
jgi:hypothetical protein